MDMEKIINEVIKELKKESLLEETQDNLKVPTGVSNRHVHLSKEDFKILFGEEGKLTHKNALSQPGQFAAEEYVTLVGPKGCIEKVRILGPEREKTQVEIMTSDSYKLGVKAMIRESGKLDGTPGIVIVGPKGCVQLSEGVIVAQRHIHMSEEDAKRLNCKDREIVSVEFNGIRGAILKNVLVRVSSKSKLDFHIDIDESNCLGIRNKDIVKIIK